MRYLGIDMGTKRVGVALTDASGAMAFPHSVLVPGAGLADALVSLITENHVQGIVIGESRGLDGAENPVAAAAKALGDELASRTGIPVHFEPELYTTQAAQRLPDGSRVPKSATTDASAAALILAGFLEREEFGATVRETTAAPEPAPAEENIDPRISIDDVSKVQVRVGTVVLAERVENADKLLRLIVDLGEPEPRQIISGIAAYVDTPETLVGRQLSFVTNLAPRTIRGLESNGMLFAVGEGETFAFMVPDRLVPPGTGGH